MTDQERQEVEGQAEVLAEKIIPRLRGEIWKSSATFSFLAAFTVFCWYRSDFAALRAEIKTIKQPRVEAGAQQFNENNITIEQSDGLLERETKRLLEERKDHGIMRRVGGDDRNIATSAHR